MYAFYNEFSTEAPTCDCEYVEDCDCTTPLDGWDGTDEAYDLYTGK